MHRWSQAISLGIAIAGIVAALWPRSYSRDLTGDEDPYRLFMGRRLIHFPIFWIGAALLAYVVLQATNPAWRYTQSATQWWLVRMDHIPWLPCGIDAPFTQSNEWRQVIVYTAAWLSVCSVWVGLTRRRSLRILLGIIVGNALLLVGLLAIQQFTGNHRIPWPLTAWTDYPLTASFIYHNHAGAYLALATFCAIALAVWFFDHGSRSFAKSTPASVLALAALLLVGFVFFTLSRGAILTLAVSTAILAGWFLLRWRVLPGIPGANPVIRMAIVAMFIVFVAVVFRYLDFSEIWGRWDMIATQGSREVSVHSRVLVRDAAIDMLKTQGLRGVGAGGFRYLFPEYVQNYPEIYEGGTLYWEHAHCDWLEFPIELGLAGDLLILGGAGWWIAFFVRRRAFWNALAVPLLLGCLQTVIHAGFDFPFQCPAILVTWCMIVAIAGRWIELEPSATERTEG